MENLEELRDKKTADYVELITGLGLLESDELISLAEFMGSVWIDVEKLIQDV